MNLSPTVPFRRLPATKAWKLTSLYVRRKAKNVCYTCGRRYPLKKLVAGHFREKIGGANTYFDLDNIRCQCQWYCNRQRHGAKDVYAMKLIKEIGLERVNALYKKGQQAKIWTKSELEAIEKKIQKLL